MRVRASILLVDEDSDTRRGLRSLMEYDGYRVLEVASAQQALDLLFSLEIYSPCLIVLDLGTPVDSAQLLAIIRSYSRWSNIPALVISGTDPPGEVRHVGGLVVHFPKPLNAEQFRGVVEEYASTAMR